MAIAYNVASTGTYTGTSPLTWSHTCTGSNLILIVGVIVESSSSNQNCTGVTYNGVAMTLIVCPRYLFAYHRHPRPAVRPFNSARHQRSSLPSSTRPTPPISSMSESSRYIKGADLLIDAVARLRAGGKTGYADAGRRRRGTGCAQGSGSTARSRHGGALHRPCPAALRILQGALIVVPSRGDSMPYG